MVVSHFQTDNCVGAELPEEEEEELSTGLAVGTYVARLVGKMVKGVSFGSTVSLIEAVGLTDGVMVGLGSIGDDVGTWPGA